MMIRLTMSQYQEQDPGDLIVDCQEIIGVLEGKGQDGCLTAMLYCYGGLQFHVRDDNRDVQDRVLKARGDFIE